MDTNYKSNAKFLGTIIGAPIHINHMDQYQPMPASLFVEQEPEQEPDPEETEKDWAAWEKKHNVTL